MTEWALPADEAGAFHDALAAARAADRPEARFLRGGFWRNFQARYREINDLHKQMLRASAKVAAMPDGPAASDGRRSPAARPVERLLLARTLRRHLHRAHAHGHAPPPDRGRGPGRCRRAGVGRRARRRPCRRLGPRRSTGRRPGLARAAPDGRPRRRRRHLDLGPARQPGRPAGRHAATTGGLPRAARRA